MPRTQLGLNQIYQAQWRIREILPATPMRRSAYLSDLSNGEIYLKLESLQPTGSFKVRGAINKMAPLSPEERKIGIVTGSAGNHGLGVAFAASKMGFKNVDVYIPTTAPQSKKDRLNRFPIRVHQVGQTYEDAHQAALQFSIESGALYIHAYDDPSVVAGQGTVGLEIFGETPEVDSIIVPIGGGGLVAGIATVAKEINPVCEVIGIQSEASPAALLSLQDGVPYDPYDHGPTIADGLAGGFGKVPFLLARTLIDEILLASEDDFREAIYRLVRFEKLIAEAAGAASIVPIIESPERWQGKIVVCVISGANLAVETLRDILKAR